MLSHLPMTDPNWHMMLLLISTPTAIAGDARVKSVIYINNQLPIHRFATITTNTPLVLGVSVALPHPHPLFTSYLPPEHQAKPKR